MSPLGHHDVFDRDLARTTGHRSLIGMTASMGGLPMERQDSRQMSTT